MKKDVFTKLEKDLIEDMNHIFWRAKPKKQVVNKIRKRFEMLIREEIEQGD